MIKYKCFRGEIMKLPNIKILDEKDKLLRTKSKEVIFPLSKEDKKNIEDMITYLKMSQIPEYEEEYIKKWMVDFSYGLDVIELALKKTTSKSNFSFDYIDKIISDWYDRNLKSAEEVKQFLIDLKNKTKNIKALEKKSYNNYEQRQYEDLDAMYSNAIQAQSN